MGNSSDGPRKGNSEPHSTTSMDELQQQMAEAAGESARSAADSVSKAIGAVTVALGLKAARPLTDMAQDIGGAVGDVLAGLAAAQASMDADYRDVVVLDPEED